MMKQIKGVNRNMSCEKCEKFQASKKTSYYRWKKANIEIRGCKEHLREIFMALSLIQNMKAGDCALDIWAKVKKIMGGEKE